MFHGHRKSAPQHAQITWNWCKQNPSTF